MSNVARGLVTIKHFDEKFKRDLAEMRFSGVVTNGKEVTTGLPVKEFESTVTKNIQSAKDRIEADHKLRVAINRANSKVIVKVAGEDMTISEALSYRTHTLPKLKTLLTAMKSELQRERIRFQGLDKTFKETVSKLDGKPEMLVIVEKNERPSILDTIDEINELQAKIDFFDLEFDAILTETNPVIALD